jgi:[protein-PII] uridylyltransferase
MATASFASALREQHDAELARIRAAFEAGGDGRVAVRGRAALVDRIVVQLWQHFLPECSEGVCVAAMGGFGRSTLFPGSDVDLLFLVASEAIEEAVRPGIRALNQEMWDLRMRVSPATRRLEECEKLQQDNVEFTISLLDCRFLAGDAALFAQLRDGVLPRLVVRERQPLVQSLAGLSHERHHKFGDTIFHLEPNVKEGPGGLRDYNVACWLRQIAAYEKHRAMPRPPNGEIERALNFLCAVRCFLHYRSGRDDNALAWEAQDAAAEAGIGLTPGEAVPTGGWMRNFFRHTRAISRYTAQALDEIPPSRSSLFQQYQQWRSRISTPDFSVALSRVYLQQPEDIRQPDVMLRLFLFMARHGFRLSPDTERRVERALPAMAAPLPQGAELWPYLSQILVLPAAALALREMHEMGVLGRVLPEFQDIDALVIRDFYHRYTVDEHSFRAIEMLHALPKSQDPVEARFAGLLAELAEPELLYFSLLLHDVGKGAPPGESHVPAGLRLLGPILERLQLEPDAGEVVEFLIGSHLEMSALLRRDIYDPATVRALAERAGNPERLRMLCLHTYADVKAVNPEAMTAWKAEDMWQLYMAASNYLDRQADHDRVDPARETERVVARVRELPPERRPQMAAFLAGLPRRYLLTHTPQAIAEHCEMVARLATQPVQIALRRTGPLHYLTVITPDRPMLFATICGVLTGWGMNIIKAGAFSNSSATVVDNFLFADPFRTLELNPQERDRFKASLAAVLNGETKLQQVLEGRLRGPRAQAAASLGETRIRFDNECSARCTVLELIAADRPGLLHRTANILSHHGCDIEIALIETEGRRAYDVFYLTAGGAKLEAEGQQQLQEALAEELAAE